MPRQNRWSQDDLENIFEDYLSNNSSGRPVDVFSTKDFEEDDDTFDFLDYEGRPEELDKGPGRPEELQIEEFAPPELEGPSRNLYKLLGRSQQ